MRDGELMSKNKRPEPALQTTKAGVWDWDISSQHLSYSPEFFRILGIAPDHTNVSFDAWDKVIHPLDRNAVCEQRDSAIKNGTLFKSEYRIVLPNKQERWIISIGTTVTDIAGQAIRFTGICMDITEQKAEDDALRQSEEKYRIIADFTYGWEAWRAPDSTYRYVSPSCARITGRKPAEFLADPELMMEIVHPEDRPRLAAYFQKTQHHAREQDLEIEFRVIATNGEVHWVSQTSTPVYSKEGKWLGRRESNRDTTQQKRTENIIAARLRLLKFAATHTLDEFLQATLDELEVLTGSQIGFYHFLGSDRKTLSLQAWSSNTTKKFCKAEGKGLHYDIGQAGVWADCVRTREPLIHNNYSSLPNKKGMPKGHSTVIREMVIPLFRDDQIVAILGVGNKLQDYTPRDIEIASILADMSWDIAQHKRSEEELAVNNEHLTMLNAEKDKFFSILAHDLRGPFYGLLGLTDLLANETPNLSAEELRKYGNATNESVKNIFKLLENLLEWAQFQTGAISFTPQELNVKVIFLQALEHIKSNAAQKDIAITYSMPDELYIRADESMLNSVLRNLLSNAIKFTRRGGSITVKAIDAERGMIKISVADNGIGMTDAIVERLFKLGEKVKSKGTENEPSNGLGLLLCKEFIVKHGGDIWVESKPNEGSTFFITVPVFDANAK